MKAIISISSRLSKDFPEEKNWTLHLFPIVSIYPNFSSVLHLQKSLIVSHHRLFSHVSLNREQWVPGPDLSLFRIWKSGSKRNSFYYQRIFQELLLHFFVIQSNFESGRISSFARSQYNSCPSGRILKKAQCILLKERKIGRFSENGYFHKSISLLTAHMLVFRCSKTQGRLFLPRYQIVAKVSKAILHNVQMENCPVLLLNKPSY